MSDSRLNAHNIKKFVNNVNSQKKNLKTMIEIAFLYRDTCNIHNCMFIEPLMTVKVT